MPFLRAPRQVASLQFRLTTRQPLQEAGEQGHVAEAIGGATAIEVVALHGESEGILTASRTHRLTKLTI